MKYRAVANGNILEDVPAPLVAAGLYVPVDGDGETSPATAADESTEAAPATQQAPARRKGKRRG